MDETARWAIGLCVTLIVAMFTWFRWLLGSKANRESTDRRFEDMARRWEQHSDEDRDMHRQVGQKLDAVVQQIGITNATLANLAGRFEEARRNGNSQH